MKHNKIVSLLAFLLLAVLPTDSIAQNDNAAARRQVKKGNKLFRKGDFAASEISYLKALEKNRENAQALFNYGDAQIAQMKDTAAIKYFEEAARHETNPIRKSQSYHNLGTIMQGRKMFAEAIEQYKQALRLNPNDDEARYNLVLCKRQLKNQPQQNQQQGQNKDENDDKQKQEQQQNKQEQQKQEQQEDKQQMSKDNAEQLLQAAMQQEKQTQKRMKEAQKQPQRRQVEKNW